QSGTHIPRRRQLPECGRRGRSNVGQRAHGGRRTVPHLRDLSQPRHLRAEGTLNNVDDFRVYRPKEGDAEGELAWRPLRRGIADLDRRAEVPRKATERYLDGLASVDQDTTLQEVLHQLGQATHWHGRRVRALQPFAPDDRQLLQAISRGEFTLNGVRNRD